MTLFLELLALLGLILLNAFFVAAEYGLVTSRRTRLLELEHQGNRRARAVRKITSDPPRFISAMQLGVTITSLAIGALGEPVLAHAFEPVMATILAVVSGLTLSGASASSHDLYATVIKGGHANEKDEVWVSKVATIVLGIVAILLGIVFEKQNVAFMVGLAFAIAASCNFPVLLMSLVWRDMTTRGAVIGGFLGLLTGLIGVILSPSVWVEVLGHAKGTAPFSYQWLYGPAGATQLSDGGRISGSTSIAATRSFGKRPSLMTTLGRIASASLSRC